MGDNAAATVLRGLVEIEERERLILSEELESISRRQIEVRAKLEIKDGILQGFQSALAAVSSVDDLVEEEPAPLVEEGQDPPRDPSDTDEEALFLPVVDDSVFNRKKKLWGVSGEVRKYYLGLGDRKFTTKEVADAIMKANPNAKRDSILNTLSADKLARILESNGSGTYWLTKATTVAPPDDGTSTEENDEPGDDFGTLNPHL